MLQAVGVQCAAQTLRHIPIIAHDVEVGGAGAACCDARQCIQRAAHACQIGHRCTGIRCDVLCQVVHALNVAGPDDLALRGRDLPGQHARQHGFAATIAPDQRSAALVKAFGQVGEKKLAVGQDAGHALQREVRRSRHTEFHRCKELPR